MDVSSFPLVRYRLPRQLSTEAFDHVFTTVIPTLLRRGPYGVVVDCSAAELKTFVPLLRRSTAAHYARLVPEFKRSLRCEAVVVPTPLARNLLTALRWLVPPQWPCGEFYDVASADAWAHEILRGRLRSPSAPSLR